MNYTLLSEVGQIEKLSDDSNFVVIDNGRIKQIKSDLILTNDPAPITENAVEYVQQNLTVDQKKQVRENIDAVSTEDLNEAAQIIGTNLGNLSDLQTKNKTNIVAAINEIIERLAILEPKA